MMQTPQTNIQTISFSLAQERINGRGQINQQLKKAAALTGLLAYTYMEEWDREQHHKSQGRNHKLCLAILATEVFFGVLVLEVAKKKIFLLGKRKEKSTSFYSTPFLYQYIFFLCPI